MILSPEMFEVRHSFRFLHMLSISVSDLYGFLFHNAFRVTASHRENNVMAQLLAMKREGHLKQ